MLRVAPPDAFPASTTDQLPASILPSWTAKIRVLSGTDIICHCRLAQPEAEHCERRDPSAPPENGAACGVFNLTEDNLLFSWKPLKEGRA
jgi:hypothetical protein